MPVGRPALPAGGSCGEERGCRIPVLEASRCPGGFRAPARCRPEVGGPLPAVLFGVGGRSADYECGLAVGSRKPHAVSTRQFRWLLAMQSDLF